MGVFYGIREICKDEGLMQRYNLTKGITDKRFIVQVYLPIIIFNISKGFGNVGYWASKFLTEAGSKLIGVVEYNGSIYDENGIDPNDLYRFLQDKKPIFAYTKAAEVYKDDSAFYKECDILIPAALERAVNK